MFDWLIFFVPSQCHIDVGGFNCSQLSDGFNIQLSTPEEIKKWREERRKNFPTEKRVKEKQKELEEKIKSGAVLETQSFRYCSIS